MAAECAFLLPSGKKCRCMATRNHEFCRHHGAPPRPKTLLPTGDRRWSRVACWRDLGRSLGEYPKPEIPGELLYILHSLLEDDISDRTAGRILRSLLQRYGSVPFMPEAETSPVSAIPPGIDEFSRLTSRLTPKRDEQPRGRQ